VTRGRAVALAIVLVTVVGVGVLVGQFASGWWRGTGGSYTPRTLVATATIDPLSSLFADPLTAEVDVLVNPHEVDPSSVQVEPTFSPFEIRSQSQSTVHGVGAATELRYRYTIECLTGACVPLLGKPLHGGFVSTPIKLRPVQLAAKRRDGKTITDTIAWPPFSMHTRVTAEEAGLSTPHFPPSFGAPPVSWLFPPGLAGGVLLALAAIMLLGAGALVASVAAGDTTELRLRRLPRLTPVERALRLAEHAAASGEVDEERKALERLAEELTRSGRGELADRARSLAWAEGDPAAGGLETFAATVRSNGAH
jgi:hypothetical protein